MVSQHCLKKLVEYFLKVNETEKLLESVRQSCCRNSYFQLETAFQRFDKFQKGYLTPSDLSEFMLENGVYPTYDYLYLVFRDCDKAKQGVVTIDRFEEELLPRYNAQLRKEVLQRKYYPPSVRLEEDLEFQLGKYFQAKLDCYLKLNVIRIELFKDSSWSTSKAFLLLDRSNVGQLSTKEAFDEFLRSNGKLLKCEYLRRIYEGIDFHREGPITFYRFDYHLDPLGRGYYPTYELRLRERIDMKAIHSLNVSTQQKLREYRERNLLEEELLSKNYRRLRYSNEYVGRVVRNQELEKDILARTRAEENMIRSRELLLRHYYILAQERLAHETDRIRYRSLYPYY